MADSNERKRDNHDTGEAGRTDVGVVPGDTMASALDPFGTVAGDTLYNTAGEVPLMTTLMAQKQEIRM